MLGWYVSQSKVHRLCCMRKSITADQLGSPGPGTPSLPGFGRRCDVPKVMLPGLSTVESG